MTSLYFDEDINQTHLEKHAVTEIEIFEFFTEIKYFERRRHDGSFVGIGKLISGRFLQVIYRKKSSSLYFIITAYDIEDKNIINFIEEQTTDESNQ